MTDQPDPIKEKKEKLKKALYSVVDQMVDTLETLNVDNYIQVHMFANDFCPPIENTSQGIILHNIFCEIDTHNLRTTAVKHQLSFDQLIKRNQHTFNMSTPIGQLMIESQEKFDPNNSLIMALESELEEQIKARKYPPMIHIEMVPNLTRPRLKTTGELIIPLNHVVTNSQLSELVQNAWRFFNGDAAKQVDTIIGKHNAEIVQQMMSDNNDNEELEGLDVIPRLSRHGRHQLTSHGTLFIDSNREVTHDELTDMLTVAELHEIDERQVRDFVFIHNQTIGQEQNRINPIRVENENILPASTGFIGIRIRQSILESAANLSTDTAQRAAYLIDAHNRVRLRQLRRDQADEEIVRSALDEEEQMVQAQPMIDVVLPARDEPGDVAQDVNRPRARPIYPEASRVSRVQDENWTQERNLGRVMQERVFQTLERLSPNPEPEDPNVGVDEVAEIPANIVNDVIRINGEVFGIDTDAIRNVARILPDNIGYINDEDRDFLIENAWRLNVEAIVMRDAVDGHNMRHLDQNGPTEIFPTPVEAPVEDYDLSDTGFSDENISRILPHRNRIEVEDPDDGEEGLDGGRPT